VLHGPCYTVYSVTRVLLFVCNTRPEWTTIRVTRSTAEKLKALADSHGVTPNLVIEALLLQLDDKAAARVEELLPEDKPKTVTSGGEDFVGQEKFAVGRALPASKLRAMRREYQQLD